MRISRRRAFVLMAKDMYRERINDMAWSLSMDPNTDEKVLTEILDHRVDWMIDWNISEHPNVSTAILDRLVLSKSNMARVNVAMHAKTDIATLMLMTKDEDIRLARLAKKNLENRSILNELLGT